MLVTERESLWNYCTFTRKISWEFMTPLLSPSFSGSDAGCWGIQHPQSDTHVTLGDAVGELESSLRKVQGKIFEDSEKLESNSSPLPRPKVKEMVLQSQGCKNLWMWCYYVPIHAIDWCRNNMDHHGPSWAYWCHSFCVHIVESCHTRFAGRSTLHLKLS